MKSQTGTMERGEQERKGGMEQKLPKQRFVERCFNYIAIRWRGPSGKLFLHRSESQNGTGLRRIPRQRGSRPSNRGRDPSRERVNNIIMSPFCLLTFSYIFMTLSRAHRLIQTEQPRFWVSTSRGQGAKSVRAQLPPLVNSHVFYLNFCYFRRKYLWSHWISTYSSDSLQQEKKKSSLV